jgi:hypothetical protein
MLKKGKTMNEGYLAVNKKFLRNAKEYTAGILLAELQRRNDYHKIRDEIDENGYFKFDVKDVKEKLGLTDYKLGKAKKKLIEGKYISCVVKDIPAKLYVKLI